MPQISLTRGYVTLLDDSDMQSISAHKWCSCVRKRKDGTLSVYAMRNEIRNGKTKHIYLHREVAGNPVGMFVDHIDGDTLNNVKSNLRVCTPSQNMMNTRPRSLSKSIFKGVTWHRRGKKWMARIKKDNAQIYLGLFSCEKDAARAYDNAASLLFGEFAKTNNMIFGV